jgi:hypothetical protein
LSPAASGGDPPKPLRRPFTAVVGDALQVAGLQAAAPEPGGSYGAKSRRGAMPLRGDVPGRSGSRSGLPRSKNLAIRGPWGVPAFGKRGGLNAED